MNRLLKTALIMTALAAGSVNGQEKNPLLMKAGKFVAKKVYVIQMN